MQEKFIKNLPNLLFTQFGWEKSAQLVHRDENNSIFWGDTYLCLYMDRQDYANLASNIMHHKTFNAYLLDNNQYYKATVTPDLIDCKYSWYQITLMWLCHNKNSIEYNIDNIEEVKDLNQMQEGDIFLNY